MFVVLVALGKPTGFDVRRLRHVGDVFYFSPALADPPDLHLDEADQNFAPGLLTTDQESSQANPSRVLRPEGERIWAEAPGVVVIVAEPWSPAAEAVVLVAAEVAVAVVTVVSDLAVVLKFALAELTPRVSPESLVASR